MRQVEWNLEVCNIATYLSWGLLEFVHVSERMNLCKMNIPIELSLRLDRIKYGFD